MACAATPSAAAVSPDVHTMKSYMALFDPRLVRAPATQSLVSKSPSAATNEDTTLMASAPAICPHALPLRSAEAEAVSGTHLYAYLQEVSSYYIFGRPAVLMFLIGLGRYRPATPGKSPNGIR